MGDITPEEVRKEGYSTFEEFKNAWKNINGVWNPDEVVTVYEFKVVRNPEDYSL